MNFKLALTAILASSGTGLFASARQECPPKPIPIRDINFADVGGEDLHGYELRGNARIVEPAPDGIPRALRIDQVYSYALLKNTDISPGSLPEVTLSISAYLESIRPCPGCNVPEQVNSYGWVISHDNGGWDRAIFLHDERFNGMGMTSGKKPNSKFALTPTLQKWIHIIGVWRQGGECALYIENQRIPFAQPVIGSNNAGRPEVAIGAPQLRSYGKGNDNDLWVKDVKIFDYALSDEEIQSLDCHFEDTLDPTIDCGHGGDLVYSCTDCVSGDGSASGCAGDCNWRPEVPNCVPKDDPPVDPGVDCGDHDAADCGDCDVSSNGPSGCSGECKFADGECRPNDWEPPVDCGTHEAAGCGECPLGEGASGCSGNCMWDPSLGECIDDNGTDISCGDHDAAECGQCDAGADGSGCSGDCKFDPTTQTCVDQDYDTCSIECGPPKSWKEGYGGYYDSAGSWRVEKNPRFVVDVNGDGKADIVAFANHGVEVALAECGSFGPVEKWSTVFGYNDNAGGWRVDMHPRMLADVNGDGLPDVVGFSNKGVEVSLNTGTSFAWPTLWVAAFGYNAGGWRVEKHPRYVVDVNGDGMADIVGFGNGGVLVALSTGTSFAQPKLWVSDFGYSAGNWRVDMHPRFMADVNGDGKADVVGFGYAGTQVALSTGTGFTQPKLWVNKFGYDTNGPGGWRVDMHPRILADVNGDGKADIVGFGYYGTNVSLSTGTSFTQPKLWMNKFGYNSDGPGGWRIEKHPRFLADVNGDGKADAVGFGYAGTQVALSTGSSFTDPELLFDKFGYNSDGPGGWRVEKHPRMLADVTGDGKADVIGFGYYAVGVGNFCL